MMETRWLYAGLLALMAAERLTELGIARRNQRWLTARGAVEVGRGHYPWMVIQHTLFLLSCLAEVWWLQRPFHPILAGIMFTALVGSMLLRYWVIATLGRRWTTRVLCLPGEPIITTGPYRYLEHPNYLAVVVEIFALPMIHTAWMTALVFTLANGWLLFHRIRVEEAALHRYADLEAGAESNRTPREEREETGGNLARRGTDGP